MQKWGANENKQIQVMELDLTNNWEYLRKVVYPYFIDIFDDLA